MYVIWAKKHVLRHLATRSPIRDYVFGTESQKVIQPETSNQTLSFRCFMKERKE